MVGRVGRVLGPRNLMPNQKMKTVVPTIHQLVEKISEMKKVRL